jgi:hypothetical protein
MVPLAIFCYLEGSISVAVSSETVFAQEGGLTSNKLEFIYRALQDHRESKQLSKVEQAVVRLSELNQNDEILM